MADFKMEGLVLYLHGACGKNNPATRVWKDLSGNGNDGELDNFGYTEDSGWVDGGLKFDGVDDYVDCGKINLGNSFTIEHIFKVEELENIRTGQISKIGSYYNANSAFAIEINNNRTDKTRLQASVNRLYRFKDYPKNNFYNSKIYLVLVFDINKGGSVYLNGEELFSLTFGGLEVDNIPYKYPLLIGKYFIGNMDLIRVYNRALTDEEILQNYQAGHEWTPQIGKREATTTMKPITSSLSRKGKGKRELISTMKPITTSLERKGKGTREVISTMKPITSSLSRKGAGRREVITTMQPITSSISKKLPPIHADIDIRERTPNITTRERIPKLEVD